MKYDTVFFLIVLREGKKPQMPNCSQIWVVILKFRTIIFWQLIFIIQN